MAAGQLRMGVKGAEDFDALASRLRAQGDGRMQERLRSRVRTAGRPVEREIKAKAASVRVTGERGGKGTPRGDKQLRARTAASVSTSVTRRGIRFAVGGPKLDPVYGVVLASYLDADLPNFKRWRYPVFGDFSTWRQNRSSGGFFFATVRARRDTFERAVTDAIDQTIREISS